MPLDRPCVRLRPWRDDDAVALAAMNADPEVMRHFRAPLSRAESDAMLAALRERDARDGFTFWAAELRDDARFVGFCGLGRVAFAARFTPAVEIGWRLARPFWGQGLAREAATLALHAAFGPALALPDIVAFTPPANARSWGLMRRLGMRPDGTFEHPNLPEGHPLRTHLLYRIRRDEWRATADPAASREEAR